MTETQKWHEEGEQLMLALKNGHGGILIAIAFKLGIWWASRPNGGELK